MLQDQDVSINISGGLDTKTDNKLVLDSNLLTLENAVFFQTGSIKKRPGYDKLGTTNYATGVDLQNTRGLMTFDDELLLYDNNNVYSYNNTSTSWVSKGTAYSINNTEAQLIRNSFEQSRATHAHNNGIYISAWIDSRGGIRYLARDFNTNLDILYDQSISATGVNPKLISCGESIFLFYSESSNLLVRKWTPGLSTAFSATFNLGTNLDSSNPFYDVDVSGENMVFAYRNTTPAIEVKYLKQDLVIGGPINGLVSPIVFTGTISTTLCVHVDQSNGDIGLFFHNSTNGMTYAVLNSDFTTKRVATVFDATLTATAGVRITVYKTNSTTYKIYYEVTAAATYNRFIKTNTATTAGAVGTAAVLVRSVGLASKILEYNGQYYFMCVHDSVLQSTYFLLNQDGQLTAKISYGKAGGLLANNFLHQPFIINEMGYFIAQEKTRIISDNGNTFTPLGLQLIEINFNPDNNFYRAKIGKNLIISGGVVSQYDGNSVVEAGFHLYPENVTAVGATTGGSMATGTYLYKACYEWIDSKGQVHRSAPSVPVSATVASGSTGSVVVTIPCLRLTKKTAPVSEMFIGIYRTRVGSAEPYYRVSGATNFTYNNPTLDTSVFTDTQADASILSNNLIYTTGGILENGSTISASFIAVHKNRIVSAKDDAVNFSKEHFDGEGLNFSEFFSVKVDSSEKIKAIQSMDDYITIFTNNSIFVMSGSGPDEFGNNNDYQTPTKLTSDIGCPFPNSVVIMPLGIMFKSFKGIYLLTRQLQLVYVGDRVEKFNSDTIMSADVIQNSNLVLFLANQSGTTLAYDYNTNRWGTYTNHQGVDATIWLGSYCYLRANNEVYQRNELKFLDDQTKYTLKIGTSWLKLSGLQNYQRVKKVSALGDYFSDHIIKMSVGYDYNEYYLDTYNFNPSNVIANSKFGSGANYGSDVVYGSIKDGVYQFQAHLRNQKCQSIRFLFEDTFEGAAGQAYSLTNLGITVGLKKGLFKISSSRKATR